MGLLKARAVHYLSLSHFFPPLGGHTFSIIVYYYHSSYRQVPEYVPKMRLCLGLVKILVVYPSMSASRY